MNEQIKLLAEQAGLLPREIGPVLETRHMKKKEQDLEKFAELIIRECIDKIETHRIPVGNSAAGEMACEWTYSALKEIRDEIKQYFGVES